MRRSALLPAIAIVVLSCSGNGGPPTSSQSSTSRTTQSSPGAAVTPTAAGPLAGPYGLIYGPAFLEVVKPDGAVAARVSMAMPSVQSCSSANDGAMLAPPVSASSDQIYFRDGDTKIRMVVRPSSATDVTTVPGGANVVSFFSVSPDDQRIAVLVEDLSSATTISERLYVEDLHGGGHHADIYSTTQPKGKTGTTLWPMGWHQGALVLAVVIACTFEPAGLVPLEWHVSNATTANRIATIRGTSCTLSFATSPAGVGCTDSTGAATMYDWSGKLVLIAGPGVAGFESSLSGVSPAGNSFFFSIRPGIGAPPPATRLVQLGPGPYATAQGRAACAWIDEDHLLAPDAVIQFPAETPGNLQVNATVTPLAQPGACAGRFPGGL
jgi:hypothetical protein